MMMFPDTATLEKSSTGQEYIYGGSVAINRILALFRDLSTRPHVNYDLLLINMMTLYDGNYQDGSSSDDVVQRVVLDMDILMQYYEIYCSITATRGNILFYTPTYQIPDAIRRDVSKNKTGRALEIYHKTRSYFGTQRLPMDRSVPTWISPLGDRGPVYKALGSYVSQTGTQYSQPAIITHAVYDLHCQDHGFRQIHLLERYTGKVKTERDFGTKLVPSGVIPLTPQTHVIFGDDIHLRPSVGITLRKKILTQAEQEHWAMLSRGMIRQKLRSLTDLPDGILDVFK